MTTQNTFSMLRYEHQKSNLAPLQVRYSLRFASLIPPHVGLNVSDEWSSAPRSFFSSWRVTFKKSYCLLYWLKYLSIATRYENSTRKAALAVLPRTRSVYTLTKAPMAHKTNSKEQYMFHFYHFTFSINLVTSKRRQPTSVDQGAYAALLTRRLFPVFETNLLFLKYYSVTYAVRDIMYFSHLKM